MSASVTEVNACPQQPPAPTYLLSEMEAASACGVSKPIFRKWVALGLIRPVPLPGGVRRNLYRASDVQAFVERLAAGESA